MANAKQSKRGEGPFILENSDGCTALSIPYRWLTKTILRKELFLPFLEHCIEHDERYWYAGTAKDRRLADYRLFNGVTQCGSTAYSKCGFFGLGCFMWVFVRIFGTSRLPTPFRWNRGSPYLDGYQFLVMENQYGLETVETVAEAKKVIAILEDPDTEPRTIKEAVRVFEEEKQVEIKQKRQALVMYNPRRELLVV